MCGVGMALLTGFNQMPPKQAPTNQQYYTNGVEDATWVEGYSFSASGSVSKNADHLYIKAGNESGTSARTYVTDLSVDLTNIKTLYIEWENIGIASNSNNSYLIASTDKIGTTATYNARFHKYNRFVKRIDALDVSALTGNYFVRVHATDTNSTADATSEIKVYRVWGEP